MSSSEKIKILLDSTYLLPIIGIDVEGISDTMVLLKSLRDRGVTEYYYTQFNIFEIIGKLGKIDFDTDRVSLGLIAIKEEFRELHPTLKDWLKALELRRKGYKDLIDLLLYTTSLSHNTIFLTRDKQLIQFLEENGENTQNIIYESEFITKYK